MAGVDRVTVTLPNDLVRDIDRREKNRSKFVAEAVRNELDRRRREELRRSLHNPHPESAELAEQGLEEWTRGLPEEDTEALVDTQRWQAGSVGLRRRLGGGARVKLGRGAVVVVELDPTLGHEQHGVRPCIVVSDPDVIGDQRFPLVCVVPVTGTPGEGLLYPPLAPGQSGLARKSFALIDHLRSIDKRRVRRVFGELSREEMAAIDEGLAVFLGLGDRLHAPGAPPVQ